MNPDVPSMKGFPGDQGEKDMRLNRCCHGKSEEADPCKTREYLRGVFDSEEGGREECLYKGCGRILVMDDEEAVRTVAAEILSYLGYQPDLAAEGKQAVAMFKEAMEKGEPYDAVIMDLAVPGGMGGREAMEELLQLDHAVRPSFPAATPRTGLWPTTANTGSGMLWPNLIELKNWQG